MIADVKLDGYCDWPVGPMAFLREATGSDVERDEAYRVGTFLLAAVVQRRLTGRLVVVRAETRVVYLQAHVAEKSSQEELLQVLREAAEEMASRLPEILGRSP